MTRKLTAAEAWRRIAEAYFARAHSLRRAGYDSLPTRDKWNTADWADKRYPLAREGLCAAVGRLRYAQAVISWPVAHRMTSAISRELRAAGRDCYLIVYGDVAEGTDTFGPEASEIWGMLALLFAEEADDE